MGGLPELMMSSLTQFHSILLGGSAMQGRIFMYTQVPCKTKNYCVSLKLFSPIISDIFLIKSLLTKQDFLLIPALCWEKRLPFLVYFVWERTCYFSWCSLKNYGKDWCQFLKYYSVFLGDRYTLGTTSTHAVLTAKQAERPADDGVYRLELRNDQGTDTSPDIKILVTGNYIAYNISNQIESMTNIIDLVKCLFIFEHKFLFLSAIEFI